MQTHKLPHDLLVVVVEARQFGLVLQASQGGAWPAAD
jgi:hypothetical protein